MRRDILIGVVLLAAPIIAIAQSAPTPPDEPARNAQSANVVQAENLADEAMANADGGQDPPPEPEAPQS